MFIFKPLQVGWSKLNTAFLYYWVMAFIIKSQKSINLSEVELQKLQKYFPWKRHVLRSLFAHCFFVICIKAKTHLSCARHTCPCSTCFSNSRHSSGIIQHMWIAVRKTTIRFWYGNFSVFLFIPSWKEKKKKYFCTLVCDWEKKTEKAVIQPVEHRLRSQLCANTLV